MEGMLWDAFEKCINNQEDVDIWTHFVHDTEAVPDDIKGNLHRWHVHNIDRVAKIRQKFLDYFMEMDYDYAMMVDTDVLIAPNTIRVMIEEMEAHEAQVAYGVFWSDWGNGPQPQVWEIQPYGISEKLYESLTRRESVQVRGGGALTLFSRTAADLCRYYPRIPSLPQNGSMWVGEDRTFALCCEVHMLKQIAVGKVDAVHLYKEEQRTAEAIKRGLQLVGQE